MIKIRYLDREFEPCFKHGAEAAVALGIGSLAAGLAGSGISASSSASIANKNLAAQREENQLNRDWQTVEAEKARQYNTSERLASQQYGIDVMNMMNEYNNPANQARRLQGAGLNPVIAMQGNTQNVSASSQPSNPASSPVPSPVGGLSPVSQQPLDLQIPQLMNGLSSMLSGLANAKKAGVETTYLEKRMDKEIELLTAETSLKQATAVGVQLDNAIKSADMPYTWKRAYNRYKKEMYEAGIAFEMQGKVKNEAALAKAQEDLAIASMNLKKTEQQLAAKDLASYDKKISSILNLQSAQTNEANASALQSKSQSKLTGLEYEMRRNMQGPIEGEYFQRFENLQKEGKIMDWQIDTAEAIAKQEMVRADHAEALFWKDFISDIFNDGVNAFLGYKNAKSWERLSKSTQDNVARKIEQMKWEYGDKVKLEDKTPTGVKRTREYRRPYSKYGGTTD